MGDYPLWLEISRHHKIHYMDERMAVYRILPHSASHNKDAYQNLLFHKNAYDIKFHFIGKYGAKPSTIKKIEKNYNELILHYAFFFNNKDLIKEQELFKNVKLTPRIIAYRAGLRNAFLGMIIKKSIQLFKHIKGMRN